MAKRVTEKDIQLFNELYLELRSYAGVARETGFSATTVKKYIISGYVSQAQLETVKFNKNTVKRTNYKFPISEEDWNFVMELTDADLEGIKELRKEILI